MKIIKKQIIQITTTASTTCDSSESNDCYIIIPDESVNYNLKILLTARDVDFGFFDVVIPYTYGYYYGDSLLGLGEDNLL